MNKNDNTSPSFEDALNRLDQIVKEMEKGSVSLDESIKLFDEGIKLSNYCDKMLKDAKQKITVIKESDEKNNGDSND